MDFEEIEKMLWDGTKDQLDKLIGQPIAYSYSPECGAFSIYGQNEMSRSHGAPYTPNCVKLFGNEYTFGSGSYLEHIMERN